MKIGMDLLKELRQMTLAPLKDCKEALVESNGDLDEAVKILKEKGVLKAGKKAGRETSEGLVKFVQDGDWFAGIKLLCETDFVAKNETFHNLLDTLLSKVLTQKIKIKSLEDIKSDLLEDMNVVIAEFVGKIGENVQLGDVVSSNEKVFVYNHPGNKVASLVYFEGNSEDSAKEVALQVAAMNPTYLSIETVDRDYYNELKSKFNSEMSNSGKPADIVEKIIEGKISKELSDIVLLEQPYIRDGAKKIKDILAKGFEVKGYLRMAI